MKGFKTLSILSVGSAAIVAVVFYLIYRPTEKPPPLEVVERIIPDELNVNFLTASFECSHYGEKWHICTQPGGWGGMLYCPAYSEYNESELSLVEWGEIGVPTPLTPCFSCPKAGISCVDHVQEVLTAAGIPEDQNSTLGNWNLWDDAEWYCEQLCESKKEGEFCSEDNSCSQGQLFCDYKIDDTGKDVSVCKHCPTDLDDCLNDTFVSSRQSKTNCLACSLGCSGAAASKLWVDEAAIHSQPIDCAIQSSHQNATGPLHDCSILASGKATVCPDAIGKMCIVHVEGASLLWQLSNYMEESGCVGMIAFRNGTYDAPFCHADSELLIPFVFVTKDEGLALLGSKIGVDAKVEVDVFGAACYPPYPGDNDDVCKQNLPCDENKFCMFNSEQIAPDLYEEGYCLPCPDDPTACYFDDRFSYYDTVQNVESCAKYCDAASALARKECKFCAAELTGFSFGVDNKEDRCQFCSKNDVQFPERKVQLFGDNITCSQMQSFFERLPVPKDSSNCQLAQSVNYICGCEGQGYAGANTNTKKVVLAWLPRTAAILSMLGSLFIIVDTQRTPKTRSKLINKILCTTSIFDAMGSFAMSFTTLPTQQENYIYGSNGNYATCKAQGFFIQMGTIACLLGVSLALYYNLAIKQGWSMERMNRNRVIYYLLVPPIVIGLAFACAGIPFYDNMFVWCNNSAKWWPELPIILAIFHATVIMVEVLYSVYQQERATSRYTGGGNRLSKMVVQQAAFFLGAFYITWVPYLVLQYMLSSGKGYDIYGLTLAASTMCALQGFWNFIVYARPRGYLTRKSLSTLKTQITSSFRRMSSNLGKNGPQERPSHSSSGVAAPVPLNNLNTKSSITETVFIPFEAPGEESADESAVGEAGIQDPDDMSIIASLDEEQVGLNEPEPDSDADQLAFCKDDNQDPSDACNSTSLIEEQIAVNEPEHTSNSKAHFRFRSTLMDFRNRFTLTNNVDQLAPGIEIAQHHYAGDAADRNTEEDEEDVLFEMLLAG